MRDLRDLRDLRVFAAERLEPAERDAFIEMAESELLGLNDGNYARYRVRPSGFAAWAAVWSSDPGVRR